MTESRNDEPRRLSRRDRPTAGPGDSGGPQRSRDQWREVVRRRLVVVAAVIGCWSAGIQARLLYLQVLQHDELVARAERQQHRTISSPAKRGDILDRRGKVLAYSVDADSIYAVPSEIGDPHRTAAALCAALDDCSGRDRRTIEERLSRPRAFAYVKRQVKPEEARRIAALELDGIGFLKENRRYYPNRQLAAHLLGYVGIDSNGLHGVESSFDRHIRGRAGKTLIQTDARHRAFSRVERPPTTGATIELTIDENLQHIAERELRLAVEENRAAGGTAIIMEPHTGELLAVANEPTFNPNSFLKFEEEQQRNRAIQDLYEPGSTFKMITAAAAFEEQVVSPNDPIDVSAGMIRFGSRRIDDVHRYGTLTFSDVIVKSSNVGAIKVGLRLGPERLSRYVRRFGFGQTTSSDFQGENGGIVWDPSRLTDSGLASISMGYQVAVTPLQMVAAANSIANGGELLEPRLVRAVVRDDKRVETSRKVVRRTVSARTADLLTTIMEGVVERGTARAAQIEGYRIAGKTGTAAKLVNGRYSKSDYNASFVGFVPSRRPVATILVMIDSPRAAGYYGGAVAAPVFKRIAEATLRQLAVPPSIGSSAITIVQRDLPPEIPAPIRIAVPLSSSPRTLAVVPPGSDLMPDVRGLSGREAVRVLTQLGMTVELTGSGVVVAQQPAPGWPVDRMAVGVLRLDRHLPVQAGDASP